MTEIGTDGEEKPLELGSDAKATGVSRSRSAKATAHGKATGTIGVRSVVTFILMGETYGCIKESDSSSAAADCATYTIIRSII
jgi:hypothetical protein